MVVNCSWDPGAGLFPYILQCISTPAYNQIWTCIKDFGATISSFLSLLISICSLILAIVVSCINKQQKNINLNNYNINLFNQRFKAYEKFNSKKFLFEAIQTAYDVDIANIALYYNYEEEIYETIRIIKEIKFVFNCEKQEFDEEYSSVFCSILDNMNKSGTGIRIYKYENSMENLERSNHFFFSTMNFMENELNILNK